MMQWSFLRKFTSHGKNYWDCLKNNKIYSLQRRRDRYRIIYIWKVPSIKGITSKDSHRRGRSCNLPSLDGKAAKLRKHPWLIKVLSFSMRCRKMSASSKTSRLLNLTLLSTRSGQKCRTNPILLGILRAEGPGQIVYIIWQNSLAVLGPIPFRPQAASSMKPNLLARAICSKIITSKSQVKIIIIIK